MSKVYYKTVRPDGKDFFSGTIDYAAALGGKVKVPSAASKDGYYCCSDGVLHASVVPTETLIGGSWPCRLFEVTGKPVAKEGHKRGFRSLNIVREVDAHLALGPQGREIAALIERTRQLTYDEARLLGAARDAARDAVRGAVWDAARDAVWDAARDAARDAVWDAARDAVRGAARDAAWDAVRGAARDAVRGAARDAAWGAARDAARDAVWDAALALIARDLVNGCDFTQAHYELLTRPWREVMGPIHPEDSLWGLD